MNQITFLPAFTPVPRLKDRSNGWKPEVQRAFIEALADTGSVRAACRRVGRTEHGAYQLRRHSAGDSFRAAWEAALALGIARIEDIAMDRAINGVEEPVYSYGALVGTRTRYNDRLLMFLLRNRAPHRFAEGGGARGLSGLDHTRLEQERQRWRKEWELEQAAAGKNVSSAQVRASIDRKIEEIRVRVEREQQREWEMLSEETREAWQRFEELKERDLSAQRLLTGTDRGATSDPQGRLPAAPYGAQPSDAEASRPAPEGENKQPAENNDSRNYTLPPDQLPPARLAQTQAGREAGRADDKVAQG
ncbi:hypothetical protein G6N82_00090 [Altererythrobacter sp. BO-6]|uniref:hypothetical protein n=1 Tax=Altererythrobacter sp. BO-6 TaxID=2604537 RepID=UPI0013E16DAE|nr:hypothetical protein [Altererythrobacter sp. BO-6]QIG52772.1 hypothetical protein G6N82_00090 [Altererythrobacter sp. BO-6]